ncbi:MAG: thioredoxin family protein [Bacteroidaceae bacterium]|nr:thioredoxin family protein [Bacteroidaceae bacterium]
MKKLLFTLLVFVASAVYGQMENPVTISSSIDVADGVATLKFKAAIESGWHLYSTDLPAGGPTSATVEFETLEGAQLLGTLVPGAGEIEKDDPIFGMKVKYYENEATFTQKVKLLGGKCRLQGYLRYGACNDETCLPPTTYEFDVEGTAEDGAAAEAAEPAMDATADADAAGDVFSTNPLWRPVVSELGAFDNVGTSEASRSMWLTFLLGFGGGFLALLTPCVWPIIPMTVSFFLKRAGNRGKALREAMLYGVSIVVIYLGLGLAVTAIFGASALNALSTNAVFNLIFFAMLVLFGASFLGGFELTLPSSWTNSVNSKAGSTTGVLSIFLMAFTLSLVSFSCTGPIIGFLLVEVSTGGSLFAPAVGMLGFALALALPFTIFALFPSMLKQVPRSGGWMNVVKVTLGFIELAFALKFLSVADLSYGWGILDREVFLALWIVLFALLGLYLLNVIHFPHDDAEERKTTVPRFFLAVASLAFSIYMIPGLWGAPCKAVSAFAPPMWTQDFSLVDNEVHAHFNNYDEGMEYARISGKPVLLDFTGYGCVNCRKMESAVWTDDRVSEMLRDDYVLITLFVDDKTPLAQPVTVVEQGVERKLRTVGDKWSYLQRYKFGANAQPFYVPVDNEGAPLAGSYSYDEDIQAYIDFLKQGLSNYKK